MLLGSFIVGSLFVNAAFGSSNLPSTRPPYDERTFHSNVVDNLIDSLQPLFLNEDLGTIFANCLPNTLDTTIYSYSTEPLDSFVITGDINALWLRDSMNQLMPYLPYVTEDANLQTMVEGLIQRHASSILIDPFANAFNFNASGAGWQTDQRTPPMQPSLFEGKYEIDSLASFLKLSYWDYRFAGEKALLHFANYSPNWINAVQSVLETVHLFMVDNGRTDTPPYLFKRQTSDALDTQPVQGRGHPARPFGLSRSLFRPSDDGNAMPYNIPGNAMMCVELHHLHELLTVLEKNSATGKLNREEVNEKLASLIAFNQQIIATLCSTLEKLILNYGSQSSSSSSSSSLAIPYEVDGYGAAYFMDDANVPSLLSLPTLGYISTAHPVYEKTRHWLLSYDNPYYFAGVAGAGIGGPHYLGVNYTWHMAISMQIMTSGNETEITNCLEMLATTTAGTGMMHESFNVNDPTQFARKWFAWANGNFGEMILQLIHTKPELILKNDPEMISLAQSLVKPTVSWLSQKETLLK
jgi:meiotically up-regulated gene 157 (Mug157) protein